MLNNDPNWEKVGDGMWRYLGTKWPPQKVENNRMVNFIKKYAKNEELKKELLKIYENNNNGK